jgi:hypothetical protein
MMMKGAMLESQWPEPGSVAGGAAVARVAIRSAIACLAPWANVDKRGEQ